MDSQLCVQFSIPIQQPKLNPSSDLLIMEQEELNQTVKRRRSPITKQEELTLTVKRRSIEKLAEPKPQRSLPLPQRYHIFSLLRDLEHTLIFNRKLFASDVNPGLMRLTMPRTQILNAFLTDDEEQKINQKNLEKLVF